MTQKEKAKAYDEALERAKIWQNHLYDTNDKDYADELNYIFPELKESEDKRIRQKFIHLVKMSNEVGGFALHKWEADEMLAWLEEQAEHANFRNKIQIGDKVTRNRDGVLVNLSQLNRVAKIDEKQGEQKVSEYDIVKTIKERIIEYFDNHLIINKCFSIGGLKDDILKIINEVKFAKQGEPTDILDDAVLDSNKDGLIADTIRCKIEKQGEQKPAWSEEDKDVLEDVEEAIINYWHGQSQEDLLDWLKSLRPQSHWKPSDEQMEALKGVQEGVFRLSILESLYQDLKKLKE